MIYQRPLESYHSSLILKRNVYLYLVQILLLLSIFQINVKYDLKDYSIFVEDL